MVARAVIEAMHGFRSLVADPLVELQWEAPSALEHYTVGGVVGHVCLATAWTSTVAAAPEPTDARALSLAEWFGQVRVNDSPGATAVHSAVRGQAEDLAARGSAAVVTMFDRVTARAVDAITATAPERLVSLAPVRPDVVLTFSDFLSTRLVELVVHFDDIAVSVGNVSQVAPATALQETVTLLLDVARQQHGDLDVLRALTRSERTPPEVFPLL